MVDLGQKKVNTRLPFFMHQIWGGELYKKLIVKNISNANYLFIPLYSFAFFMNLIRGGILTQITSKFYTD